MRRWRYRDHCPACKHGMFSGDTICPQCCARVRSERPDLLPAHAKARHELRTADTLALRAEIIRCAREQLPTSQGGTVAL